jgi:hypothetical protein
MGLSEKAAYADMGRINEELEYAQAIMSGCIARLLMFPTGPSKKLPELSWIICKVINNI